MKALAETPEELAHRMDRLYITLARMHRRLAQILGVEPRRRRRQRLRQPNRGPRQR